jgi:ABC-type lipoprotein release transport system permease subunit
MSESIRAATSTAWWGLRAHRGTACLVLLGAGVRGLPAWDAALVLRYAALLVTTTVLAALWPAWRASRQSPAALLA